MWKFLVLACLFSISAFAADAQKVELVGKVTTGLVAIGGETTGASLETKDGTYELDFGKNEVLKKKAEEFNGSQIRVAGTLEIRKGVEVKERKIVLVSQLERDRKK